MAFEDQWHVGVEEEARVKDEVQISVLECQHPSVLYWDREHRREEDLIRMNKVMDLVLHEPGLKFLRA